MIKIEIYGTGCPKCEKMAALTHEAATTLGLEFELEKVTDITRITASGIMMTPALAVDGQIKVVGKVPDLDEIKRLIS